MLYLTFSLGLAFTSKQIEPEPAVMGAFSFRKLFGDADFIASGVISFPVGGMKPGRGSKDNTYVGASCRCYLFPS